MNTRTLGLPLLLCSLLAASGATAWAAPRPVVVELYTSQGCSSCPPADAFLGELAHRSDVLALAFHVDYWNSLGWTDRFTLPYAAERQRRYVQTLHLSSAFTPQIVIDGRRSFVGSDRRGILPALSADHDGIVVALSAQGGDLVVEVGAGTDAGAAAAHGTADVLLLALLPEARTAIGRGENGGHTLQEFNIVRATYPLGSWSGGTRRYTLARSRLPPDVSIAAVLVQQAGQGSILGAAECGWQ